MLQVVKENLDLQGTQRRESQGWAGHGAGEGTEPPGQPLPPAIRRTFKCKKPGEETNLSLKVTKPSPSPAGKPEPNKGCLNARNTKLRGLIHSRFLMRWHSEACSGLDPTGPGAVHNTMQPPPPHPTEGHMG